MYNIVQSGQASFWQASAQLTLMIKTGREGERCEETRRDQERQSQTRRDEERREEMGRDKERRGEMTRTKRASGERQGLRGETRRD